MFTFKPATRESAKLLIGLDGPSGTGKTLSALKLATGIGGPIAFIDTEQGRALQYAGDFDFLHGVLSPPFSPERYREAVEAAIKAKPNVVIVDSMSHVWEGPGGILETVDGIKGERGGNDFSAWAKPKQAHQKLVNLLLQVPAHVIICFRAKEKRGLVPDARRAGKMEVVNLGWHPICEQSMVYELTVNVLLSADKKGVPIVDGFDFGKLPYNMAELLPPGEQISEATGRRFADWCRSGAAPANNAKPKSVEIVDAEGSVVATYASYGEALAGLEILVKDFPSLPMVEHNKTILTTLFNSMKTPPDIKERAGKLLDGDLFGDGQEAA